MSHLRHPFFVQSIFPFIKRIIFKIMLIVQLHKWHLTAILDQTHQKEVAIS
jgi:hypothetical protein